MFKKIKVNLPGFKYPVCYLRELSISQLNEAYKQEDGTDLDTVLFALKCGLLNEAGDKVFNAEYTVEEFADESPGTFILKLSDAFTKLNVMDDEKALKTAKN
jgi:hypothetical protein